ncbi:sugar phosphate isomerase/epimerase family protein [Pseudomonas viridiflava]|uniref:sugar phosphate isomerase/epimerase family protein n=1 Tax=Pseudomonas viridiflava TaxID=33069 RepID=UPI0005B72BBE|nr:TIM barrel protein [Pseudomonas viridiflava]KIQ36354.1 AP endonuclease [Pseudomonas viridiflava]
MAIHLSTAPCCWGVDDVNNPYLPPWRQVLSEAAQAGYRGIELGPYGYLPLNVDELGGALAENGLHLIAGTIFDNLVDPVNLPSLLKQAHDICALLKALRPAGRQLEPHHPAPYLVIIDWGHEVRDYAAGHSDKAPRLNTAEWSDMMAHIRKIADVAHRYGVRAVIHPHAGGYIEFADELAQLVQDIHPDVAGLCLDTGHLYYAGMDPAATLRQYASRLDYLHFKDIDPLVFDQVLGERITSFAACAKGVMCPLGRGIIDYPALRTLIRELDYQGYITVEQERDPRHVGGSLADVTESRTYLTGCGF